MKERKRKITIITVIGIMLILAITTFTYAIWSRTHTQTGINKNTYACFEISYAETNGAGITMENGIPQKDEEGLKNDAYEVQIKNTCSTTVAYDVILNKEWSSNLDNTHLKVAVDNDYKLLSAATLTDKRTIADFNNVQSYIIGSGTVGPKLTKTIKIRSWMDEKTTEEQGENKSFTFKITIETAASTTNPNNLVNKIIAENEIKEDVPDFSKGYPNSSSGSDKSGLYKTEDDDGDTYYFRGKVDNNYVQLGTYKKDTYIYFVGYNHDNSVMYTNYDDAESACNENYNVDYSDIYDTAQDCINDIKSEPMQKSEQPILWRIVRINGDGTVRLVTDNPVDFTPFNETSSGYQYVGYTYDNTTPCTKDKPCKSEYHGSSFTNSNGGDNSTIKTYLENWYITTLNAFDDKIALTSFCNDTSYGSGNELNGLYYGPYKRIETDKQPSLQCPDPTKQGGGEKRNYGGVYKLKVGLLTADEMNYAGMSENSDYRSFATRNNYLLNYLNNGTNEYWYMWSMSPYYAYSSYAGEFYGYADGYIDKNFDVSRDDFVVRPVINLKSDVTVTGSGTEQDPYVVQ